MINNQLNQRRENDLIRRKITENLGALSVTRRNVEREKIERDKLTTMFDRDPGSGDMIPILVSKKQNYFLTVILIDGCPISSVVETNADTPETDESERTLIDVARQVAVNGYLGTRPALLRPGLLDVATIELIETWANRDENFFVTNEPKEIPRRIPLFYWIDVPIDGRFVESPGANALSSPVARCYYSPKTGNYHFLEVYG
jgi:hypothetical protein